MIIFNTAKRRLLSIMLFSLSICIGVASVFLISSISNYGIKSTKTLLDRMGLDGYVISAETIKATDIIQLSDCRNVEYISPTVSYVSIDTTNNKTNLVGGNSQITKIYSLDIAAGNFFSNIDVLNSEALCVISSNTAKKLFNSINCIGQKICFCANYNSQCFTVIGVYQSDKISEGTDIGFDEPVYVPYTTLNALTGQTVHSLLIKANSSYSVESTTKTLVDYCDGIFGNRYYKINDTASQRDKIDNIMSLIKTVLELIVGVSLLVSVCGLMVIMIINIKNRTKEIGLKKALGASNLSVLLETSVESAIIAVIGTINGYILYKLITLIFAKIELKTEPRIIISTFAITVTCAFIIGLIPGYIAAKIRPAIALKSEK